MLEKRKLLIIKKKFQFQNVTKRSLYQRHYCVTLHSPEFQITCMPFHCTNDASTQHCFFLFLCQVVHCTILRSVTESGLRHFH